MSDIVLSTPGLLPQVLTSRAATVIRRELSSDAHSLLEPVDGHGSYLQIEVYTYT